MSVSSNYGTRLYKKNYRGGAPDYVQVIDLSKGASVVALHGDIQDSGSGKGMFGGNDARFRERSLEQYWKQLSEHADQAYCVTNGQFFLMGEYPTRLPFPLKSDGAYLTDGYAEKEFPGKKLMLEVWKDRVNISEMNRLSFAFSNAPTIIAGLAEDANKHADRYVARTFVGVEDRNNDRRYETLLIYSTSSARQVDAAKVLRSFGADKVMMLDGGGSTQLICQGKGYINSDRLIPQALGVIAGVEPDLPKLVQQSLPAQPFPGASLAAVSLDQQARPLEFALIPSGPQAAGRGLASIQEQPAEGINLNDVVLVPAMMLPLAGLIFLAISRMRHAYQ